jgi:hypothetical protein
LGLATERGIHIGSTEQEVMTAYAGEWNKNKSLAGTVFVAGTPRNGLTFDITDGRVSAMLLRAGIY